MRRLLSIGTGLLALTGTAEPASGQSEPSGPLLQKVTLHVHQMRLPEVLRLLRYKEGVPLAFSADRIPLERSVSLDAVDQPVREVLETLLKGTGLTYAVTPGGTIVVVGPMEGDPGGPDPPATIDREALDVALAGTGIFELDDVVTMGSAVGASPEREQATGVQVVDRRSLSELRDKRMGDLIRQALPGVVLWDRGPTGPPPAVAAVRGLNSFGARAPKTYVDGVELAEPELFTLIDGWSVERLEFVGGPQGAALYGPDALGGILQISTRAGTPGSESARLRGRSGVATHDRTGLDGTAVLQEYSLGVTGGGRQVGIDAGGSFSRLAGAGLAPWVRSWSLHGGSLAIVGPVSVKMTGRAARYDYRPEPTLLTGDADLARVRRVEERGVGVSLLHRVREGWTQTVVLGHSWAGGTREGFQSPLLPPLRQLAATDEVARRTSLRYATTLDIGSERAVASVSAGGELSRLRVERAVRDAVSGGDLSALTDDTQRSGGVFGQVRLRPHPSLVLSGGLRGEHLSSVGTSVGTVWASTAGLSWSRDLGAVGLRVRGAWGRGIRPPAVGMASAAETPTVRQVANPLLAPERQHGVEAGIELYFPAGGWLAATWFSQRATDLIETVDRRRPGDAGRIYQFQNVGAITNRGAELSAGVASRSVVAQAGLSLVSSRVATLSPTYTGELEPGDRLIDVPELSGSASVQYYVGRMRLEVGATALGPWTGYDWIAIARATRGLDPVRLQRREYWRRYPFRVRPSIGIIADLGRDLSLHLRIDNPSNTTTVVRDNLSPRLGRTVQLGVQLDP